MDVSIIFGLIFAVIVITLILFFGWEQIATFLGFSKEAQILRELKTIENEAEKIYYMAENSRLIHIISIPSDYKICFLNTSDLSTKLYSNNDVMSWKSNPAINTIIRNKGYNIWYYGKVTKNGYIIEKITTESNFCVINGMKIYLKNVGDYIEIIPPI